MGFQEWEDKIDNRISSDIIAEFKEAVRDLDIDKMNELHQEWHLFFDCPDEESSLFFAKVEDGVMVLPEAVRSLVNKDVRYKWVLKDTANLYLVEDNPKTKYVEDAVKTSSGRCIDEGFMYISDNIVFDDTMQKAFNWRDEDVAAILIFMDSIRIDKW